MELFILLMLLISHLAAARPFYLEVTSEYHTYYS